MRVEVRDTCINPKEKDNTNLRYKNMVYLIMNMEEAGRLGISYFGGENSVESIRDYLKLKGADNESKTNGTEQK